MGYKRIDFQERMNIFRGLYVYHLNPTEIAERLKRRVSTITREIKKGWDYDAYNPVLAEAISQQQRSYQRPKGKIDTTLWKIIKTKLLKRWSPEQISKFLHEEGFEKTVCAKTIYNHISFHLKGELKKLALQELRQRGKKRKVSNIAEKRGKLQNMTLIDKRPAEIDSREMPGHWEGDLIIGKDHKSALCVTVERQSRFVQIDLLKKYDAKTVRKTIEKRFKKLEPFLRKTITFDQGKENSEHETLSENLKIDVYFCHPHSPWEKGTCENTNYLIRDMLGDLEDFSQKDQRYFSNIAKLLNERPRKTLDWKNPKQAINKLR